MSADMVGINRETVRQILHNELNMRQVCAKLVPKNLPRNWRTTENTSALSSCRRSRRSSTCWKMSSHVMKHGFYSTILKCIGNRCIGSHRHLQEWKKQGWAKVKAMLIISFFTFGVFYGWVGAWGSDSKPTTLRFWPDWGNEWGRSGRISLNNKIWMLHQDNAPAQNTLSVKKFLSDKSIPVLEHSPYSSDLAPCDFFCSPKWKVPFVDEMKAKTAQLLNGIGGWWAAAALLWTMENTNAAVCR